MKLKSGKLFLFLGGVIALFLIVVAVKDWAPAQVAVEKTVVYGNK